MSHFDHDEAKQQFDAVDTLAINTIRTLAIDGVEKANSGHAGAPMALAPLAYVLWNRYLRYDPKHPNWVNRDRFVLSCGHASMLLYAVLHLAKVVKKDGGKEVSVDLDALKAFRQIGSCTPGHPEYHMTTGVETTTGPLGQGAASSVGMAMASRHIQSYLFNGERQEYRDLVDYNVYAVCSDGDMMEGVCSEAASLAGHLKLSNLCWFYDHNHVTIEGNTPLAFSEEVGTRFLSYGWRVLTVDDVNDLNALSNAIDTFLNTEGQPTLIIVKSVIGFGAPTKQNTSKAHSDPLGKSEVEGAKQAYGWPLSPTFLVPDEVYERFKKGIAARGHALRTEWNARYLEMTKALDKKELTHIDSFLKGVLPPGWDQSIPTFKPDAKGLASRDASGKVLNAVAEHVPWVIGGSADLAPSTKTYLTFAGAGQFSSNNYAGRNLHFGIREHAMGAIANGMALCGLKPFCSTFLVFSDYMRPAMRLAALMEIPVLFVFTHDSIGVGEDGPTHQPVEHLVSLRAIPGLVTIRPCDAAEVAVAYRVIMETPRQPFALVLSRQALPTLDRTHYTSAEGLRQGGYILKCTGKKPNVILIATGSEIGPCVEVFERLVAEGILARVVSLPSWELFEKQDQAYRDTVLPPDVEARVVVEQASVIGWDRYAGARGRIIGMSTFGVSAPLKDIQKKFGFTTDAIYATAKDLESKFRRD